MLEIVAGVVYNMGASQALRVLSFLGKTYGYTPNCIISSPEIWPVLATRALRSSEFCPGTGQICLTNESEE
jgi:hypothetical protein